MSISANKKENTAPSSMMKTLALFTLPLILSGLLQQIFNWVDAFIVGNVEGEQALAGIGATTSIYNLFVTVIVGFTSGVSVLTAQRYGMGERRQLREILSSFALLMGGIFLAIAAIGIPLTGDILTLLDTPAEIFAIGKAYMQIMFLGIPFLAVYNVYSAVLRGVGDSKAPFLAVLVCSCINGMLDVLLVVVFPYGAAGAAAATVFSQGAMTVFLLLYTIKKYPLLRFSLKERLFHPTLLLRGSAFSMPPAAQAGASSLGNLVLQRFMNGFGEQTVAAITTAYRVDCVIILPIINFGSGIATLVAQNIGAGNQAKAKQVLKTGAAMIGVISLGLTAIVLLAGEHLIALFGLTPEAVAIGKSFFYSIALFYIVYGFAMAVRGYLEGLGDMLFSGLAGLAALGVRVGCSYGFAGQFGNKVIGYAEAFSWGVLLLLYLFRYRQKSPIEKDSSPKGSE